MATCNLDHGVYFQTSGRIIRNVFKDVRCGYGIHLYAHPHEVIVAENTSVGSRVRARASSFPQTARTSPSSTTSSPRTQPAASNTKPVARAARSTTTSPGETRSGPWEGVLQGL
jgi:hypothetical protein